MTNLKVNPTTGELDLVRSDSELSAIFLKLDQTVQQTTVGTFRFPSGIFDNFIITKMWDIYSADGGDYSQFSRENGTDGRTVFEDAGGGLLFKYAGGKISFYNGYDNESVFIAQSGAGLSLTSIGANITFNAPGGLMDFSNCDYTVMNHIQSSTDGEMVSFGSSTTNHLTLIGTTNIDFGIGGFVLASMTATQFDFGALNILTTGDATFDDVTCNGQIILPNDTPVFTYHDMQRGTVTCGSIDAGTTAAIMLAPNTFWASATSQENNRGAMAVQDAVYTNTLQENGYMGWVWRVQLPTSLPVTYYSEIKAQIDFWHVESSSGSMTDCNLYIYNNNTATWVLLGTSAGDESTPASISATITSNISYYIDASFRVHIMFRNKNLDSGDFYTGIDWASVGMKITKSTLDNTIYKGNLTIAGDLSPQGAFIPKDIPPLEDNIYALGNSSYRWKSITGNVINAYNKINLGSSAYGVIEASSANILFIADNDSGYSEFVRIQLTESNPENNINYSNWTESLTERNFWNALELGRYTWKDINLSRYFGATSDEYGFETIMYDMNYSWTTEGNSLVSPLTTDRIWTTMIKLSGTYYNMDGDAELTAPLGWCGIYVQAPTWGGDYGYSNVKSFGLYSEVDIGLQAGVKLYFDGSGGFPNPTGDTYLAYHFTNSELQLYADNVLAMVFDNDEIESKVTFKTSGGVNGKITTVTTTYTILVTDETVICNKVTAFTVTLPTAVVGQKFTIKNIGAGVVTIDGSSTDTIDGDLTQNLIQWESAQLQCYVANKWGVL